MIRNCALLAILMVIIGCGPTAPSTTAVKGKITVGAKGALPGGSIQFILVSDPTVIGSAQILGDGTYQVANAPIGECKVTIDNSHLKVGGATTSQERAKMNTMPMGLSIPAGMGGSTATKYLEISSDYASQGSTSLKATVANGGTAIDFDLK